MSKAIFLPVCVCLCFFFFCFAAIKDLALLNHFSRTMRTKPWMLTKQLRGQRPLLVIILPGNGRAAIPGWIGGCS